MKWGLAKVGDVCKTGAGGTPLKSNKNYYEGGDIPWLLSGEVSQGEIHASSNYITKLGLENSSAKIFPANTVLVAMYGATAGQTGILRFEAATNQAVCGIYPNENFIPEFLYYCLLSKKDQLISQAVGNAQPNISQEKIRNTEIPIPPKEVQKIIVETLDSAFENIAIGISNAEKNLINAQEIFSDYLNDVIVKPSDSCEKKSLGEIAEYFNGLTYSPKDVSDKGIIVLRSSNIQNDKLDFSDIVRVNLTVKDKIKVRDGDILMCSRNGSKRLVGKTATIQNLAEEMTFGTFMMIIRSPFNRYLSWFFKSKHFRSQIAGGENTMINQITRYMLDDVTLNLPSVKDQEKISGKLEELSIQIRGLEAIYHQKLLVLEELKKTILNNAVSGELSRVSI